MNYLKWELARAIPCPYCMARAGEPCSGQVNGRTMTKRFHHTARYRAAGVK